MNQQTRPHALDDARNSTPVHRAPRENFDARDVGDPCREIDDLFDSLSRLAAADLPPETFHEDLLAQAIREAGAFAGAIWSGNDRIIERRLGHNAGANAPDAEQDNHRRRLVVAAVDRGQSRTASLVQNVAGSSVCRAVCVVAPFHVEHAFAGAVELLLPATASEAAQSRALRLVEAFAEVIGDYHHHRQLNFYRTRELDWKSLAQLLDRIHHPRLHETAIALANEGRWFVRCDRIGVIHSEPRACKVLAVSGVERIERSRLVDRMQELAATVALANESIWSIGEPSPQAPQIEQALEAYLEESHATALVALPLRSRRTDAGAEVPPGEGDNRETPALGVLVLEWFATPTLDALARERIELLARHGATAIANSLATDRLPLIGVNRAIAKARWLVQARQLPKTLWAAGIVAAMLAALVFVPVDFEIAAEGELQPAERREIFAPADGVVETLLVEHGNDVAADQPLLRLRSPALDIECTRIQGEIQTAEKRLAAIRAARFERDADQEGPTSRYLQLTAEEEELKEALKGLTEEAKLLSQQRRELEVRSPLPGRVLTWDVARSLSARPVERGQSLLSVGSVAGEWVVELCVADKDIGFVLAAYQRARASESALPISFLLAGEPGVTHEGKVERIALRSHVDERSGEPVVLVTVRLDEPIVHARPGAGVVGKIYCGRRSLGFVWLHDAWNSIRRRVLF